MTALRVLWTLPYLPWPITSGGKARQFHLLREMARRGHAITLLVQSKTPLDDATRAALEPLVERLIVLPRRPLRDPRTLWFAACSAQPLLASVNGHAPELSRRFVELLREPWDVVQVEHSYGFGPFEQALAAAQQPFILTEHNVESALGAATYGKWPAALRPFAGYDRWRARRWERRVLAQAAAIVAVTEDDAQALSRIGARPAHVVPNGVDVAAFSEVEPALRAQRVLFVGNFEYAPNMDAVEWAAAEILPRLWQRLPQARFVVCGHALPKAWATRFPDPRIEWRGYVPRLQDVQAQASAFLAPLRFGGGSKLKVLEALAAGLPLVSTREGVSGLHVANGTRARVADDAAGLAGALAEVLLDARLAARLSEAGRALAQDRFDWSAAAAQLEAVYRHPSVARRPAAALATGGATACA